MLAPSEAAIFCIWSMLVCIIYIYIYIYILLLLVLLYICMLAARAGQSSRRNMQKYAETCRNMQKHEEIRRNMQKHEGTHNIKNGKQNADYPMETLTNRAREATSKSRASPQPKAPSEARFYSGHRRRLLSNRNSTSKSHNPTGLTFVATTHFKAVISKISDSFLRSKRTHHARPGRKICPNTNMPWPDVLLLASRDGTADL
jgi:hypothetical protein